MTGSDIDGFSARHVGAEGERVFIRTGGRGPAVLLLHGFPETGLMWQAIAPQLADNCTVVVADLPGYGRSDCPDDTDDHSAMSKRAMAAALVAAMAQLGHDRFAVVGHDRGGRVAYRAALDHPTAIAAVAVLDVVPTLDVWDCADARLALAFWPFSLLAQPAPLPETLILAAPEAVVDNALGEWGTPRTCFPEFVRDAYVDALRDPTHVRAICEEYRAAATIDRDLDAVDRAARRQIDCPLLALWSATGGLASWYDKVGGPLGVWRRWGSRVEGEPVKGGHFFPEEDPGSIADRLRSFLAGASPNLPARS